MRLSFPNMGSLSIVLNSLFSGFGCEVLPPPAISKRTLELGIRYSPETVCLPFKLTLGNMLEALEHGADTIVTCGGVGPCRLGYYAEVQKRILQRLGYNFDMVIIEPNLRNIISNLRRLSPKRSVLAIYTALRLAIEKMAAIDSIQRCALTIRPRERQAGATDAVENNALRKINAADNLAAVRDVWHAAQRQLRAIELVEGVRPLRVGIVGEIYVMLEPFVNFDLDKRLGRLGVEVHKTMLLSDYVNGHLFKKGKYLDKFHLLAELAKPYIGHYVGGHGLKSIAQTVYLGQERYDGIIHVYPFSCMPEVIAINILPKVSKDWDIPVLSIACDEQSGDAGVATRLEAFIDLLHYRRLK